MNRSDLAESYASRIVRAGGNATKEEVDKVIAFFEKHMNVPAAEVTYDRFNKALDAFWHKGTTETLKAAVVESWKDALYMANNSGTERPQAEPAPAPAAQPDQPGARVEKENNGEVDKKTWTMRAIVLFLFFLAFMMGKYFFPHIPDTGKVNGKLEKEVASLKTQLDAERAKPKGCSEEQLKEVAEKTATEYKRQFLDRLAGKKK
jgi:hypothetical protein